MSEINTGDIQPSVQAEEQQESGLNRRDFLKVAAAVGLTAVIHGGKIPSETEVEAVYHLLSQNHARRLEGYVDPVESYPRGEWDLTSVSESPFLLYEDEQTENYGISTDRILEEQELIKYIKGDYVLTRKDKRLLVHLGFHGQQVIAQQDSRAPVSIKNPAQLGAISVEGIHPLSAWQDVELVKEYQNHTTINLATVQPEIVTDIERDLTVHMGDWVRDLDDSTVVLATDIPMNEAIGWEVFFQVLGNPSAFGVAEDLGPLKQSAEYMSVAVAASTAGDMIRNLFKGKVSRRDFLRLPWRLAKVGMISTATAVSIKPIVEFYNSHTNLLRNVDTRFINERVNLKVKDRQPEHFLGRVETLLQRDPSEVSLYEVYFMLRDLTSSYKEIAIAENGFYSQNGKDDFMSTWGALHDTKLGLFTITKEHLLELIQRFNQRFGSKIDMCFAQNPENKAWQVNVQRSVLWTAAGYKTKSELEGRKIESADVWQFPELENIFRKD